MKKINLTEGIENIEKMIVISGRDLGKKQRAILQIDGLLNESEPVEVIIPDNICSINSSFFLGVFGDAVRSCGSEEAFLEKFKFKCSDYVMKTIKNGIFDALNNIDVMEI